MPHTYDNLARASSVVRQGDASFGAFANDHHDVYTYGDRNELTKSKRYNNTSPGTTTNEDSGYHRQFVFDTAGSWDWFQLGSDPNTPYVPNNLNLYASINDPNDPGTPTESFTYDEDQNLTEVGGTGVSPVRHTCDAENRLIEVLPAEDDPARLTADSDPCRLYHVNRGIALRSGWFGVAPERSPRVCDASGGLSSIRLSRRSSWLVWGRPAQRAEAQAPHPRRPVQQPAQTPAGYTLYNEV